MKKSLVLASLISLGVTMGYNLPSLAATAPLVNGQPVASLSTMLQKLMPAVVNIAAQGDIPQQDNPFAEPNDNTPKRPQHFEALGSGVIVDGTNGYILTNAHVIREAKTITVTLSDGRVFQAKVIGMDPPSDIAVLQIKAEHLTVAPMGNSEQLKVGDFVAAIGNPFGLNQTATSGIISALQRTGLGIEGYENFIQTDASINPGNSGGALVNLQGQLIGINTAILAPGAGGGNIGIGFAIPINMAQAVMAQLIKYGSVSRGLMGILVQDFTPALASAFHVNEVTGALVSQVSVGSPAASAGIKAGDLIQAVNGVPITNAGEVRNKVGMMRVGGKVDLKILRGGKTLTLSLVTADPKRYTEISEQKNPFIFGMSFGAFDETIPGLGHVTGVRILTIAESSMGWRAGLRPGDVIVSANQTTLTSMAQLQQIAEQSKDQLLLNIMRPGAGALFVVLK